VIKKLIAKYPTLWEMFKFLLVGGIATIIDFLIMGLVLYLWDPVRYSHNFLNVFFSSVKPTTTAAVVGTGIGFGISLLFNYLLSVFFVFTGKNCSTAKAKTTSGFSLFAILGIIGLGIHTLGMWIFFSTMNLNEWAIKIFFTLVVLVFNYYTRKKLIFNKKAVIS